MNNHQLSLDDLVRGLEHFGERYEALDVFARDLREVGRSLMERKSGEPWPVRGEPAVVFDRGGRTYKLRFHPSGIARLTRAQRETRRPSKSQTAPRQLGALLGTTVLDHALPAEVIGFLVGATLGDEIDAPRRVFTMHYDPSTEDWCAYDGSLLEMLREKRWEVDAVFRATG